MGVQARAFWVPSPGVGAIRSVDLPAPGHGDVVVRARRSGVSRGTERLVFRGRVPASQYAAMRAPFQEGELPGPVKYGYLSVGIVEHGPEHLLGRRVFCLHPHQTRYVVPADSVVLVPDDVPEDRAVLAGTMETAVNALWDAAPLVGDRATVIGAGMVGCCVARLLARMPGVRVTVVDVDPGRAATVTAMGARFATPQTAEPDQDVVIHASATADGLQLALDLLAAEGEVIELSWYGDADVPVRLGGAFHSSRLAIRASQVGTVSPRRAGRSHRYRLELALELLRDPVLDRLINGRTAFDDLPERMGELLDGTSGLCQVVTYDGEE